MRRLFVPILLLATLSACTNSPVTVRAFVHCAQPSLRVTPERAAPGATVTLKGKDFFSTCEQSVSPSSTPQPYAVDLVFSQKDEVHEVVSLLADAQSGEFMIRARVPVDAHAGSGRFRLADRSSAPARITVTSP